MDNVIPVIKTITWLPLSRSQGHKPLELSGTFRTLPPESTPTRAGSLQNPPEPTPTRTGTLRNLPRPSRPNLSEPSGTYLRNLHHFTSELPEPSGTCLRNLHQHMPELSGTFLRNLPEPFSGTCSCDPHRHTPELIWAEDPISLHCWGKTRRKIKEILERDVVCQGQRLAQTPNS